MSTLIASTDGVALALSIGGVVLSSVVLAYVAQTYEKCNGQPQDPAIRSTGIFLIVIASIVLAASVAYWFLLGYRNSSQVQQYLSSTLQQLTSRAA